jgi:Ser/Thr protein kinase RdoA (MazF antagonist)
MEQAITYSILSAEALGAEIAQAYPVDTPETCQLLLPSKNDTYLVTTGGDRYIARVYRARWRSWSEIAYELELLTHLAAKGVPVSVPIPARDGTVIRPLLAPEGTRHLVLFTYAEGKRLSWKDEAHSQLAGRLLAAIHAATEDFVSRHTRFCLDLEYLIDRPLAAIHPFLAHRPADRHYLEGFASRLRARAEVVVGSGLDWGVCHGDFGAKNIHITEDRRLTVFDFDRCGAGWRAYDFALIQWGAMGRSTGGMWEPFLRAYAEVRRPGANDVASVPLFHAMCHLSSLGVFAENASDWGTLRVSDWLFDREFAFLRKWEAEHLQVG